jgi:hypothetical protein
VAGANDLNGQFALLGRFEDKPGCAFFGGRGFAAVQSFPSGLDGPFGSVLFRTIAAAKRASPAFGLDHDDLTVRRSVDLVEALANRFLLARQDWLVALLLGQGGRTLLAEAFGDQDAFLGRRLEPGLLTYRGAGACVALGGGRRLRDKRLREAGSGGEQACGRDSKS